jgi:hypothetical protein
MRVAEHTVVADRVVAEMMVVWVELANEWWLRTETIKRNYKWSCIYLITRRRATSAAVIFIRAAKLQAEPHILQIV